jgi:hypothetical protein
VCARFGEPDSVVAPVPAVGGLSSGTLEIAALEFFGSLPVNSSRWIRDFSSSSSSQTVDGAAVELDDSDASLYCPFGVCCETPFFGTDGDALKDLDKPLGCLIEEDRAWPSPFLVDGRRANIEVLSAELSSTLWVRGVIGDGLRDDALEEPRESTFRGGRPIALFW